MTGRACKEMWAMQRTSRGSAPCVVSNDPTQPEAGPSNRRTRRNESSHKANDPLATVGTDDRPRGVSSPHGSTGQSSEHVVASAPQLRRQVDDVDPQECKESQTRDSSDASEKRGGLQTHMSSETTQAHMQAEFQCSYSLQLLLGTHNRFSLSVAATPTISRLVVVVESRLRLY